MSVRMRTGFEEKGGEDEHVGQSLRSDHLESVQHSRRRILVQPPPLPHDLCPDDARRAVLEKLEWLSKGVSSDGHAPPGEAGVDEVSVSLSWPKSSGTRLPFGSQVVWRCRGHRERVRS